MLGNINALGISLVILSTPLYLWRFGERPQIRNLFYAVAGFLGLCIPLALISAHHCNNGNAVNQWLIPGVCLFLCLLFSNTRSRQLLLYGIFIAAGLLLTIEFSALVHTESYTGNPDANRYKKLHQEIVSSSLKYEPSLGNNYYPEGWLQDVMDISKIPYHEKMTDPKWRATVIFKFWHTPLTGLYGKTKGKRLAVWYPGGVLSETADKIQIREMN